MLKPREEGARLSGLPLMVAATAGNDTDTYSPSGIHLFPLEELLRPLMATASRCGLPWEPPFLVYRANRSPPSELTAAGQCYAVRLRNLGEPVAA
jgi:putative NADPH-quinone reductase